MIGKKITSLHDLSLVWKVVSAVAMTTIITISIAGWFSFQSAEERLIVAAMAEMNESLERQVSHIEKLQRDARRDVKIISMMDALRGYGRAYRNYGFDPEKNVFLDEYKLYLEQSFAVLLNTKKYLQVRLIGFDDDGMELIRIDAPLTTDGKPVVVQGDKLQNKGNSPYTKAGFMLGENQLYVSPIGLNREHGFIEIPYLPTQRFVAPIYLADGDGGETLFGIVVINIDASIITGSLENNAGFEVIMTNNTGGILAHPNSEECWGFEFGRKETLEKLCSFAWREILDENTSGDEDHNDIHLASTVSIDSSRGDFLGLVLSASRKDVLADVMSYKRRARLSVMLAIVLAVVISGFWIARLIRPISELTRHAVLLASGHTGISFEVDNNDEVGRLGKAFSNLINQLQMQKHEADLKSDEVRELNDSLESKVEQRTRELVSNQETMKQDAATRQVLNQMLQFGLKATSPEELLDDALGLLLEAEFLSLDNQAAAFLTDTSGSVLVLKAQRNLDDELKQTCARVPFGKCLCGKAAETGEILFKNSVDEQHHIRYEGMKPHGHFNVPLKSGDKVLGLLNLYVPHGAVAQEDDYVFLRAVSDILAGALKRLAAEEATAASAVAAEEASVSKSAFLANMSHEIRTPMTAILGYTDLLGEKDCSEGERLDHLKTIKQNGSHLLTIINDILDISKIESGKMAIETMPVSIWQIVDDVVGLMMVRAEERGIELISEYSYPLPKNINGDPVRLRQILVNLVGNAIKFTGQGEVKIQISMESDAHSGNDSLQMAVQDTGIGMTPQQASKLFKPFSQADVSTTRKFGGTGLGLTISKRLSEMMGGTIALASQEGKGSVFTVLLPFVPLDGEHLLDARPEALVENEEIISDIGAGSLHAAKLLLAEDTIVNQKLAVRILTKAGHTVETADNGKIAMEMALAAKASSEPYDLILMDMLMPVMDGYEATTTLRDSGYDLPIVALTAAAMAGDRDKCLAAGCDDFATKPFNKVKLLATIQEWVDKVKITA